MSRDGAFLGLLAAIPLVCILLFRLIKSEKYRVGLLDNIAPMVVAVCAAVALTMPELYLAQKMLGKERDILSVVLLLLLIGVDAFCLLSGKYLEEAKGHDYLGG